jgi:hypothetical protein
MTTRLLTIAAFTLFCLAAGPATRPTAATRVAYVIDASQSMKPKFADARDAVLAAVKDLPADTQFAVVIDIGDVQQRYPQAGLGAATDANKTGLERFLKNDRLVPKGDGHLDTAVTLACKMKVAAVWLYSDGDFPINSEQVVKRIIAAARENKVAIHTSLALAGTRKREEVLLQIAKDTGGVCLNDKGETITELPPEPSNTVKPGQNIFDAK